MGFKNIIHYYQNISFFFPAHIFLHYYVLRNVKKIIPGLYEYKEAYKNNKKCTDLVPLPVDVLKPDAFKKEVKDGVVRIFFGKKPYLGDFYKKGYGYFDDALIKLKKEGEKFELVTASGVPFNEYIQLLQSCHILLDQSLSYDRGMSGVIGMANGMVTFSGNEQEIQTYWPEPVPCINALPDPDFIYSKLKYFLNNPDTLRILGEDSYNFVMKYHSLTVVTKKYLKIWCEE